MRIVVCEELLEFLFLEKMLKLKTLKTEILLIFSYQIFVKIRKMQRNHCSFRCICIKNMKSLAVGIF